MQHNAPGLRPTTLSTYLASLGLFRVLSEQADSKATATWKSETLVIETAVDDLADFLVNQYRPTPIVSPWNGGSGYGAKDVNQRRSLDLLTTSLSSRLSDFKKTDDIARTISERAAAESWAKEKIIQRLRNTLPDSALPWLDTTVVLTNDSSHPDYTKIKAVFPPLAGTGGNDGRLDFSSNFHQRLADVLPELGAKSAESLRWVQAMLSGGPTQLKEAAVGQFDPLAAGGPGSSALGAAGSLVNPWTFIMMLEGMMLFAASPARRLGETGSRAATPFTVNASPDGPIPGAADEDARGEFWTPIWSQPLILLEVRHLLENAKASWAGRTATQSAHMYAAMHSGGIDRQVDRMVRYGLVQRNGLAYTAVPVDEVSAQPKSLIHLAIAIESRARAFSQVTSGKGSTGRQDAAYRAFEQAHLRFVREVNVESLLDLLASLTDLEVIASTSLTARTAIARTNARPLAKEVLETKEIQTMLQEQPELRIAADLASQSYYVNDHAVPLVQLLCGAAPTKSDQQWHESVIDGFGQRPLIAVLADLLVWLAAHHSFSSDRSGGRKLFPSRERHFYSNWRDAHAWMGDSLDPHKVERDLKAMLALDWDRDRIKTKSVKATPFPVIPIPELAILQAFAGGFVKPASAAKNDVAARIGLDLSWPNRIRAGQFADVMKEVARRLRYCTLVNQRANAKSDDSLSHEDSLSENSGIRASSHPPRAAKEFAIRYAPPRRLPDDSALLASLFLSVDICQFLPEKGWRSSVLLATNTLDEDF